MPLIEVYAHPEVRRYKSSIISCAVVFQLAIFAIIVVAPFIIAYRTYGKLNIFLFFSISNHIVMYLMIYHKFHNLLFCLFTLSRILV